MQDDDETFEGFLHKTFGEIKTAADAGNKAAQRYLDSWEASQRTDFPKNSEFNNLPKGSNESPGGTD